MKKNYFLLAITIMALFLTASGLSPKNQSDNEITESSATDSIPVGLQQIFNKSCMDCHAKGGSQIAMSALNFSKWGDYAPVKQVKKASAICNEVSDGSMPPKSFRKAHPEAIPTEAQKDSICKWSASLTPNK
jgi:mono/diheme cytochrome c family protein